MAASLGMNLYPVPEVTAFYREPYVLSEYKVDTIVRELKRVMKLKGWKVGNVCDATQLPSQ